jgi:intracellular septation protein A
MLPGRTVNAAVYGTIVLFILFTIVAFASATHEERGFVATSAKMEFAFSWTLRAVGTLITVLAAVQLFMAAGQSDTIDQVVPSSVAVMGGLTLALFNLNYHWVVVVVFGVLALALIGQQLLLQPRRPSEPRIERPPGQPPETGFQAR